jgi:formylglycine-generating enzyme required for sulfatase activity
MAGNAWEWVFDWYSEATYAVTIAASDVVNPEGPTSGTLKVVRGGNFQFDWDGIRTTARTGYNPNARDLVGFRCVVDLTNPAAPAVPPASQPVSEPPALGSTAVRVADGAEMLYVPAGTFAMGAADAYHDEAPVHEVTLDAFWIDKTEVTNAQWKLCVDAGPCNDAAYGSAESINGDAYPVAGVSWSQAAAYCAWAGARLPTEAEWEYVARGPESLLYPWGDDLEQGLANCAESDCADGFEEASPVGSFPHGASWVGAVDMAGNGWEWVNDWYNEWYYDGSPERNPPGPVAGTYKVIRGGAWSYNAYALRTSYRYSIAPEVANPDWAFRCAADRPITSSAFDWVVDGAAVAFWATGVGWLDGRTRDGTVGVAPQIEGFTGTLWRVHLLEPGIIALECLGDQEGPRWLDCGTEAGGPVGLSPTTEGRPGTRWSVAFFDRAFENRLEGQELVTRVATTSLLRCLGPTSGPRLLAVGGPDGEVRLAEESTSWAVVQ